MTEIIKVIDAEEAKALLKRAVKEKGKDYIYPSTNMGQCHYVRDGEPSCIVGHVIGYAVPEALVPIARLEALRGQSWSADTLAENYTEVGYELSMEQLETLPVRFTAEAGEILKAAQEQQDTGSTWGVALVAAINAHSR